MNASPSRPVLWDPDSSPAGAGHPTIPAESNANEPLKQPLPPNPGWVPTANPIECPKGRAWLLPQLLPERTCRQAPVEHGWCPCHPVVPPAPQAPGHPGSHVIVLLGRSLPTGAGSCLYKGRTALVCPCVPHLQSTGCGGSWQQLADLPPWGMGVEGASRTDPVWLVAHQARRLPSACPEPCPVPAAGLPRLRTRRAGRKEAPDPPGCAQPQAAGHPSGQGWKEAACSTGCVFGGRWQ